MGQAIGEVEHGSVPPLQQSPHDDGLGLQLQSMRRRPGKKRRGLRSLQEAHWRTPAGVEFMTGFPQQPIMLSKILQLQVIFEYHASVTRLL